MLDFLTITILIIAFVRGYLKGIVVAIITTLGVILGIMISLKLSGILGAWLLEKGWASSGWVQIISYAILFIIVLLLVRLLAKAIKGALKLVMLGWIDGICGGLLYMILATIVFSSVLWLCNQMHLISPETIAHSYTYKYMEPLAPWVFDHIGAVLPFFKTVFSDLKEFFQHLNQTLPEHVGAH